MSKKEKKIENKEPGITPDQTVEKNSHKKDKNKKSDQAEELLQEWQIKYNELNDKYLRLYSEFDNYRKRTQKERLDLSKNAAEDMILSLLPVMDDLERALALSIKSGDNDEVIPKDGLQLIYQKFKGILIQKGLEAITSMGEPFDVDFHDAITKIPAPTDELKGKVVDEVEKGYKLNGKVIRYSKVVVGN